MAGILPEFHSLVTRTKPWNFLRTGYDFQADLDGNSVSLSDQKYRDKVVLVTLSGNRCTKDTYRFSGPATGQRYFTLVTEFNALMDELLTEDTGR